MTGVVLATVAADYSSNSGGGHHNNVIILPAGLSKAHPWVGVGNYGPQYIPKPFIAPRWLPHYDPTYTASWVPFAPEPRHRIHGGSHNSHGSTGSNIPSGFGHPKGGSIVSGYGGQPAISVSHVNPVGYHAPINPHQKIDHYFSGSIQSPPHSLQALDNYAAPSELEFKKIAIAAAPHSRSIGFQREATLHVGSPRPGAAPPAALGIKYRLPKSHDIIHRSSQASSDDTVINNIEGRSLHDVYSSYFHQ